MSVLIPSDNHYGAVLAAVIKVKRDHESKVNLTREAPYTPTGLVRLWMQANYASYDRRYANSSDVETNQDFDEIWQEFTESIDWSREAPDNLQVAMLLHCLFYNCDESPNWEGSEAERTMKNFFADIIRPTRFGSSLALSWEAAYEAFYQSPEANQLQYCI